jgi:hypothetical protein
VERAAGAGVSVWVSAESEKDARKALSGEIANARHIARSAGMPSLPAIVATSTSEGIFIAIWRAVCVRAKTYSVATHNSGKLNHLERLLPEGLLVDSAWLTAAGYSNSLRAQYVAAGWLERPVHRVYRRPPRGPLSWQQAVISLQTLLGYRLVVGGRTALELQGYAHYVPTVARAVHLYGSARPPSWVDKLPTEERFVYHNSTPLFGNDLDAVNFPAPDQVDGAHGGGAQGDTSYSTYDAGTRTIPWGQWDWPLIVSAPERAVLELLDELPDHESFHQVDVLMEGLSDLSPRRLQTLLSRCRNVKVNRLFFFFAHRHQHAWLKHVHQTGIELGSGKRMLVRGGHMDPTYQITVPRDLRDPRDLDEGR